MRYSAVFAGFVAIAASAPVDLPTMPTSPQDLPNMPDFEMPELPEFGLPSGVPGAPTVPVRRSALGVPNLPVVGGVVDSLPVGQVTNAVHDVKLPVDLPVGLPVKRALDLPALPNVGLPVDPSQLVGDIKLPSDLPAGLPVKRALDLPALPNVGLPVDPSQLVGDVKLPVDLPAGLPVKRQSLDTGVPAVESAVGQVTGTLQGVVATVDGVVSPVVGEVEGAVAPVVGQVEGAVAPVAGAVLSTVSNVEAAPAPVEHLVGLKRDVASVADPKVESTLSQVAVLLQSVMQDQSNIVPSAAAPAVAPVLSTVDAQRVGPLAMSTIHGVDVSAVSNVMNQLDLNSNVELVHAMVVSLLHM